LVEFVEGDAISIAGFEALVGTPVDAFETSTGAGGVIV
jgi:hypothetical protein